MLNQLNFLEFIDHSPSSYLIIDDQISKILYTNNSAKEIYGITTESGDIQSIFSKHSPTLATLFQEEIKAKNKKETFISGVLTLNHKKEVLVSDLRLGYFNKEEHQVYMEIIPKNNHILNIIRDYIDHSSKPTLVLECDSDLTVFYCSNRTKQDHQISDGSTLSQAFRPEEKEDFVADILSHFQNPNNTTYYKQLQILKDGSPTWYALTLDKLDLGEHGVKLVSNMTCIEQQIHQEQELDNVSQYFDILQSMCKGLLYRYDVKTRTIYRNEETAKNYNIPAKTENFPTKEWLDKMMPQEDQADFMEFMDKVTNGIDGSHDASLRSSRGDFEHHRFTFKAVRKSDGTVKEMVGSAMNIHHLKEAQKELDILNQYFAVIQEETACMIYRYDIKNHILHRNSILANKFGFPLYTENYPSEADIQRVAHPEDRSKYRDFFQKLQAGEDSILYARTVAIDETYEHHKLTGTAIRNSDGSIREMLVTTFNVHKDFALEEKDKELKSINQYFGAIQELSDDLLYRIDIPTRSLIRREKKNGQANLFGMNVVASNYPESVCESGFIHPDDVKSYLAFGHDSLKGLASTVEVRMKSKSGEFGFRRIMCVPVPNDQGDVTEMLGKVVNIQNVRNLEELANYDALTNTLNKRAMLESTTYVLTQGSQTNQHALFFLDLDDFKYVNDNLGHAFGDILLKELGTRLKDGVRHHDLVGRVGGDEFVLFLRDVPSAETLKGKAKMLLSAISEDTVDGEKRHSIHGSIGIALYPDHGTSYEELYHHADLALYRSKHKGKNQVTIYSADMREEKS